jgi:hypothetical protein
MIEQKVTQPVADVDWNDDRDVVLTIWTTDGRSHRRNLTSAQARELSADLLRHADEAERAADELARPGAAHSFDAEHIGPDCAAGKHPCDGGAWDDVEDIEVPCDCPCHPWAVPA